MSKRPTGLGGNAPAFATAFTLAFEFVGAVVLFWLLGRWIDGLLDSEPVAQIVGAVIGWVGGFLHLYFKSKGVAWETVPGTRQPARGDKTAPVASEAPRDRAQAGGGTTAAATNGTKAGTTNGTKAGTATGTTGVNPGNGATAEANASDAAGGKP